MSWELDTVQALEDCIRELALALTWKEDELHGTDDAIYWKEHDLRALQARRRRLVAEIHAFSRRLNLLQRLLAMARRRSDLRTLTQPAIRCPCTPGARMYARP